MNKIKIDNYYKPESKTLRLDEVDYTIIPNSDIKLLLDKLQRENTQLRKENTGLKEQVAYLRRSCERKEETVVEQQQELVGLDTKIDKAIKYINENLIISSILDGKKTYCLNNYTFDYKELLDILKEVSE